MSIPLFISLTISLVLAPLWSHQLLKGTFSKERKIIAMDNAAILLGRSERETFSFLRRVNEAISNLEAVHHIIHPLLVLGTVSPEIVAQDGKLESLIDELHKGSLKVAKFNWSMGKHQAEAELLRMGVPLFEIRREDNLPVREIVCPICHLNSFWEMAPNFNKSYLRINDASLSFGLWIDFQDSSLIKGRFRNYQLVEG